MQDKVSIFGVRKKGVVCLHWIQAMWGAVVARGARWPLVGRGGRSWGAVVVCGARWLCGGAVVV